MQIQIKSLLISFFLILSFTVSSAQTEKEIQDIFQKTIHNYRDSLMRYNYQSIIYILEENGKNALTSFQVKGTSWDNIGYLLNEARKEDKMLYVYPAPKKKKLSYEKDSMLDFPVGGFSIITKKNIENRLTVNNDIITYRTDSIPDKNGHYGVTIKPENNYRLSYGWYFPDCFEIISYKCNRKGYWQRQNNFIHFTGNRGDNNYLFDIKFRRKNSVPEILLDRSVTYSRTFKLTKDTIQIIVKDPEQLDGDIISLNLNGDWILKGFELTKAVTKLIVPLGRKENYLILHAENTGRIPPNTAEIEILDGKQSHKIILNSEMGKSEGILLMKENESAKNK